MRFTQELRIDLSAVDCDPLEVLSCHTEDTVLMTKEELCDLLQHPKVIDREIRMKIKMGKLNMEVEG